MSALSAFTFPDLTRTLTKLAEPPRVFVCSSPRSMCPFTGMRQDWNKVLIDRKYYRADDRQMALLKQGMEPEDLELIELDPEEDE